MPTRYETIEIDCREIRISNPGKEGPTGSSRLDSLLELAMRDEREVLGDAPWPKASGEPQRVQPSRRKK